MSRFISVLLSLCVIGVSRAEEWTAGGVWKGHGRQPGPLVFAGDGKTVYLASGNLVRAYDTSARKQRGTGLLHRTSVAALHVSADGKTLTTLTQDGSLCVWDPGAGRTKVVVRVRLGGVLECAAFAPDGKSLATLATPRRGIILGAMPVRLWEVTSGKARGQLPGDMSSPALDLRFAPDGKSLAVVVERMHMEPGAIICESRLETSLWDLSRRKLLQTMAKAGQPCFRPDGKSLAALDYETKDNESVGLVKLIDPQTGKAKVACRGHKGGIRSVCWAADGKRLATGGQDRLVKLWDPVAGKEVASLSGHTGAVLAVAFSGDGQRLASVGEDRTVRLWVRRK
jgi:WD40 repeat protein